MSNDTNIKKLEYFWLITLKKCVNMMKGIHLDTEKMAE